MVEERREAADVRRVEVVAARGVHEHIANQRDEAMFSGPLNYAPCLARRPPLLPDAGCTAARPPRSPPMYMYLSCVCPTLLCYY